MRPALRRLDLLLSYAEATGADDQLDLSVVQLPFAIDDRWLALPFADAQKRPAEGTLSLVLHAPPTTRADGELDLTEPLCGLVIDEWNEVIPHGAEATALALHFNSPEACAPQAMLLAVHPGSTEPWSQQLVAEMVRDTLLQAKLRLVDLDALSSLPPDVNGLPGLGHYLPFLHFAYNTADDTVSTDFTRAAPPGNGD